MVPVGNPSIQQVPRRLVSVEDMFDKEDRPHSDPPHNPMHILESVDGDDEDDNGPPPPTMDAMDVDDDEDGDEVEDNDAELSWFLLLLCEKFAKSSIERLSKEWNLLVYVFFRKTPRIEYKRDRQCHVFECAAGRCKSRSGRDVHRFLDKGNAKSTSNLRKHAKGCWGDETVAAADATQDLDAARKVLVESKLKDGSITAEFERIEKGKATYSHHQHTKTESQ
jgi:hypothetical protein